MSEADDLRQLIREAHEATKDLRQAMKQAKDVIYEVHTAAANDVDDLVAETVKVGLDQYETIMTASIAKAEQAVFDRFERLSKVLLGETPQWAREVGPSIPEIVEQIKNRRV